ncbi:HU family DNA-binding protein [Xanthomonas perforans]|jgi:nucleoid DNA-binding protein|uniref:HU family DNA-binding protein n=8 Tax=Xanthomonas TaxID=338 RepID=A0AAJ0N6U6_9XANT|nr:MULTISPECIES: HU family DNA-binding protein [Xanthomonas]MEB1846212.1 HU family DNA-binding protein [Xanthomonas campestris pv. campestris]APO93253.1 hypothetical protein BI313_00355 [Xanthomonas vesicatoria]APO97792.1 hypothetical protein BJD13_00975 [Xanthomonas perforans]APP78148.1 hypothetical protein BJD12_22705 [Xanthomonas vesicatoria ATCC 35937]APP82619.1 hypothetical protein BJD10_23320 [Xanthomonas hortorum pv. gardneri]
MNRKDLVELLAHELDLPKHKTTRLVAMLFEAIVAQLGKGREVNISGFGVFGSEPVTIHAASTRRLAPSLQSTHTIRRPTFRPSDGLTRKLSK